MMIGAKRMMIITTKKISVGSVIGKYCAMFSIGILFFGRVLEHQLHHSSYNMGAKIIINLEKAKSFASLSIICAKIFVNLHPESKLKIER